MRHFFEINNLLFSTVYGAEHAARLAKDKSMKPMRPYAKLFMVAMSGITLSSGICLLGLFFQGTKAEVVMEVISIVLFVLGSILLLVSAILCGCDEKKGIN